MLGTRSRFVVVAFVLSITVVLLMEAGRPACAQQDTQPPWVANCYVSPMKAAAGDPLHITTNVSDNIGVTEVTADGVSLSCTRTGIVSEWQGDITAGSSLGFHHVTIVAKDAAGNSYTDSQLGGYQIVPILALPLKSLTDPIMGTYAGLVNAFKTWGRVAVIDANKFDLSDGVTPPILVICTAHGLANGDFVVARGNWVYNGAPRQWLDCQKVNIRKIASAPGQP